MSGASDMVIRVEGLSKQYRLGEIGTFKERAIRARFQLSFGR